MRNPTTVWHVANARELAIVTRKLGEYGIPFAQSGGFVPLHKGIDVPAVHAQRAGRVLTRNLGRREYD